MYKCLYIPVSFACSAFVLFPANKLSFYSLPFLISLNSLAMQMHTKFTRIPRIFICMVSSCMHLSIYLLFSIFVHTYDISYMICVYYL